MASLRRGRPEATTLGEYTQTRRIIYNRSNMQHKNYRRISNAREYHPWGLPSSIGSEYFSVKSVDGGEYLGLTGLTFCHVRPISIQYKLRHRSNHLSVYDSMIKVLRTRLINRKWTTRDYLASIEHILHKSLAYLEIFLNFMNLDKNHWKNFYREYTQWFVGLFVKTSQ